MEDSNKLDNEKVNNNSTILTGKWAIPELIDCFCQDYNNTKKEKLLQVLEESQILAQIRIGKNGGEGCYIYLSSPIINSKISELKQTASDLKKYIKNKNDSDNIIEMIQEDALNIVKPLIYKLSEKEYGFQLININSAEDESLISKFGLTEVQSIKFSENKFVQLRNRVIGELEERAKELVNLHSDKIDEIYGLIPYNYKLPKI